MRVYCNPVDNEAGKTQQWPWTYKVTVAADTELGEQHADYTVNAGSQWEACIFAKRRIRAALRPNWHAGKVRIVELQRL
jgi:hypothetical protein